LEATVAKLQSAFKEQAAPGRANPESERAARVQEIGTAVGGERRVTLASPARPSNWEIKPLQPRLIVLRFNSLKIPENRVRPEDCLALCRECRYTDESL
jgi:hypothetical protein